MIRLRSLTAALAAGAVILSMTSALSQAPGDPKPDPPPPLPKEVLADRKLIAEGEAIWKDQCAHCHGAKAYPGKAPKLTPLKYTPEFVWDRVHNGFRGMPPWKDVYTPDQIIGIVAWIMSEDFWP